MIPEGEVRRDYVNTSKASEEENGAMLHNPHQNLPNDVIIAELLLVMIQKC